MPDETTTTVRERVWIEKVDKTTDPPVVTEVMIENGVQQYERIVPPDETEGA